MGGGPGPRQNRGTDIVGRLPISFQEAALGGHKSVRTGGGNVVEIAVPPGVEPGGRLRVPGQGAAAPGRGGMPGDMYLDVEVTPDTHLRRNGLDIELDLPVSMTEAALGAKVEVPTVEGPVTVSVPPEPPAVRGCGCGAAASRRPTGRRGDHGICRDRDYRTQARQRRHRDPPPVRGEARRAPDPPRRPIQKLVKEIVNKIRRTEQLGLPRRDFYFRTRR